MDSSGRTVVKGRAIEVGARLTAGTGVMVLIEEEAIRITHDGRQLTATPRRRKSRSSKAPGSKG